MQVDQWRSRIRPHDVHLPGQHGNFWSRIEHDARNFSVARSARARLSFESILGRGGLKVRLHREAADRDWQVGRLRA